MAATAPSPINQSFDQLRRALTPDPARAKRAQGVANHVRDQLRHHLDGLRETFLTGSVARKTAIRPLDDVDVFVVLDPAIHTRSTTPHETLRLLQRALKKALPQSVELRFQTRSIGLRYSGNDIRLDLVPALPDGERYTIPDRERDAWINTAPRAQKALLNAADQRIGGQLRPLIRLAKCARRHRFAALRSYHLEVMAWSAFTAPPGAYADGFTALLGHLAETVIQRIPDPTHQGGPRLALDHADRLDLQRRIREAHASAQRALDHAAAGRLEKAHAQWRHVFGGAWPG